MKAFVKVIGYTSKTGRVHIRHSLRIKTQRKELEGNAVKVVGENPLKLLQEGFEVERTGKKGRPIDKPLKEIVVSEITPDQAEEVKDYLERTLSRTVYGVYHDDESKPHVHCMMKAKERETDRALRFDKKDLNKLYQDIGQMLGHEITPYGQGRPSIPFRSYVADEEYSKQRIVEMKRQDEVILTQIKQILDIYGSIDIYALYGKGERGRFTIKENVKSLDEAPLKRLKGLNSKGEGILFRPHGKEIKGIFVDDIDKEKAEKMLKQFNGVLVQTSKFKYQLHLTFDRAIKDTDAEMVQRALAGSLEGDPASVDIKHLRRLPGFANPKYDDKPFSKIIMYQDKARALQKRDIEYFKGLIQENSKFEDYYLDKSIDIIDKKVGEDNTLKTWNNFFDGDRSVADMRYTVYLISSGFKENEVKDMLKAESPDLLLRKKGHTEDYLDRTIHNAKYYLGLVKERDQSKIRKDHGLER